MAPDSSSSYLGWRLLALALLVTTLVYWPGLHGGWLFDDYPNIVDNHGVQPVDGSLPSLLNAALSSPASDFKRPLASLSFAANYLAGGLDPFGWKLTNLLIHLLNGVLLFMLSKALLRQAQISEGGSGTRIDVIAALIAAGWMLLPINLTAVLYVVQREESLANLLVLLGLIGYVGGRRRMLENAQNPCSGGPTLPTAWGTRRQRRGFWLCLTSITLPTAVGILAKETAVMLPLYAVLVEWILFDFEKSTAAKPSEHGSAIPSARPSIALWRRLLNYKDWRIVALFLVVLVLPMIVGLAWLLPNVLDPASWATRNFSLQTRLLSEARIVWGYLVWTLLPIPQALSFYHDGFNISAGLLAPWTTLASQLALLALALLALRWRRRRPLVALGIALFLGAHLLTGTILPLELVYEHRNYFASFGILLAVVPLLATAQIGSLAQHRAASPTAGGAAQAVREGRARSLIKLQHLLLAGLMLGWIVMTATTAYAWGDPLRLAEELAWRAPDSPRAQYELGRAYIIYSRYDPASPYTRLAYAPLERAANLPYSSILPQQALIFMNSRMHLPLKDAWWESMTAKLRTDVPGVQDESSLIALVQCARDNQCDLPAYRMTAAFQAAMSHPAPSARLLAAYGDYAWNVLNDPTLGERMIKEAVRVKPSEPAYRITLVRMLLATGHKAEAVEQLKQLERFNVGGRLNGDIEALHLQLSPQ